MRMKLLSASPIVHAAILLGSSCSCIPYRYSRSARAAAFAAAQPPPRRAGGCHETTGWSSPSAHMDRLREWQQRNAFRRTRTRPISSLYAKKKRTTQSVEEEVESDVGSEGGTDSSPLISGTSISSDAVDEHDGDPLSDVDQEPKNRPARKKKNRKAKLNGSDGEDPDEDLLHWVLDADRAVVHYRTIDDRSSVGGTNGLSTSALTQSKFCASKADDKTSVAISPPPAPAGAAALSVRFVVRGPPRPLVRHRVSTFRMYNPSAKAQKSFQGVVRTLISNAMTANRNGNENGFGVTRTTVEGGVSDGGAIPVLFPTESLAISIAFRMRRPLNHFMANRRQEGRLKKSAPPQTFVTRTDVDNLAKFVLDSLNGLLYDDDRQVCSLHATKILDDDGLCLGSTEVGIRVLDDHDLPQLLDSSFGLFATDEEPTELA